jgi:hypothetical protein
MEEPLTSTIEPERPGTDLADPAPCTADTAECTCPDFCERDHGNE